jgi:hypothetical protein
MCLFGLYSTQVQHVCNETIDPLDKIIWMQSLRFRHFPAILAPLALFLGVHAVAGAYPTFSWLRGHPQDGITDILLEKPLKSSLRLISGGESVMVSIDYWNAEGLHGAHGVITWEQIQYDSQARVFHKLMDRTESDHWILLGELQLAHPEGRGNTDSTRSFEHALKLDSSASGRIQSARSRAAAVLKQRDAAAAQALLEVNQSTRSPGRPGWLATPWKPLSFEESRALRREQQAMVEDCLSRSGLDSFHLLDADWLLIFSDLPALELAEVLEDLEKVRRLALSPFKQGPGEASFHGTLILILCDQADDFVRIEETCFGVSIDSNIDAACHASGSRILINLHHDGDHPQVLARLLSQVFVAAQHHHVSPAPLPRWAFEGLREYVTTRLQGDSPLDRTLRPIGHRFIRNGGDLQALLKRPFQAEEDPETALTYRAVAYLICSLMSEENPEGLSDWIRAVKSGESWEDSLQKRYGVDFDQIVHVTREWYLLND